MGEHVEFPSNGTTGEGYLAMPSGGSGPGVIVIQEWWGLVDHIKHVADRFAADGFVALAPDLYHGSSASLTEPDEAGKLMMSMSLAKAGKDLSGAVDFVAERSTGDGIGVVGFCMGGGLTLMLASQRPDKVKAAVPFYGAIPWEGAQPDLSRISAAVQGHYAADDDWASPEVARALEKQLRDLGKDAEVFIYEGACHAFFNDDRPEVYNAEAAAKAWERTIAFLKAKLASS
jgi:carboxymethylenebutenolidase